MEHISNIGKYPNAPLSSAPVMEHHHTLMSNLKGHVGQLDRERENPLYAKTFHFPRSILLHVYSAHSTCLLPGWFIYVPSELSSILCLGCHHQYWPYVVIFSFDLLICQDSKYISTSALLLLGSLPLVLVRVKLNRMSRLGANLVQ